MMFPTLRHHSFLGSPTPSSVTVDNLPSLPDPVQLVGVADPFGLGELPEVPVPPPSSNQQVPLSTSNSCVPDLPHPIDPQAQPQASFSINNELYAQLLDLGFDDFTARLALIRTANTGVEEVRIRCWMVIFLSFSTQKSPR
ncbi:hypothetical protein OSTOST_13268, partial [Ostertagia ostertagi]